MIDDDDWFDSFFFIQTTSSIHYFYPKIFIKIKNYEYQIFSIS